MSLKKTTTTITDHMDGQPSIVLANGNWGEFDPTQEKYVDTGLRATPEDDATAVKYYKLSKTAVALKAPSQMAGWHSREALDAKLEAEDWDEDPLTTNEEYRFCWIASYAKTNITDEVETVAQGRRVWKPHFTFTSVRLWSNYAPSPKITVDENGIISITDIHGNTISQAFVTPSTINGIAEKIEDLQKQVDDAVEAYAMEGAPTMSNKPVTDWLLDDNDIPITDNVLKASIFRAHLGDSYTDLNTFNSYRFVLISGGSEKDHTDYAWEVLAQSDYTEALAEIAKLGREKMTIHLDPASPNNPYRKGDMWITTVGGVTLTKVCINNGTVYKEADWVQPYATQKDLNDTNAEISATKDGLAQANSDIQGLGNNLTELGEELDGMNDFFIGAIADGITKEELRAIQDLQGRIDIEQRQARSNMGYLVDNQYLSDGTKTILANIQTKFLKETTGSVDKLQATINRIIADGKVDEAERGQYNSAYALYKTHMIEFNDAVALARKEIEERLEAITNEKVDAIEVGGRNLFTKNTIIQADYGLNSATHYDNGIRMGSMSWADLRYRIPNLFKENGKYTISGYYSQGSIDQRRHMRFFVNNTEIGESPYSLNGIKEYFSITFTVSDFVNDELSFIPVGGSSPFILSNLKIEKGNKATDWTPAPEDVQSEIDEAKKAGTDASAEVVTMGNSLTTMVNTVTDALEDKVIDEAERKTLIAEQKTLDTEQARLLALVNSLLGSAYLVGDANNALSDASDATLKASTGTLDVYQMTIDVMINAVEITAPMISAYEGAYDNHKDGLSSLNVAIENARKAIDIEVKRLSDEKVDSIEIGGRNLAQLTNSKEWRNYHGGTISFGEYKGITTIKSTDDGSGYIGIAQSPIARKMLLRAGEQYIISLLVRGTVPLDYNFIMNTGSTNSGIGRFAYEQPVNEETFVKAYLKITGSAYFELSTGSYFITRPTVINEGDWIEITQLKIEKGTKATDWTPAPEDVQAEIDKSNAELAKIADDNLLTPSEKQDVKKEWEQIVDERSIIIAQAGTYGIPTTAYASKYSALSSYVTPLLADMTTDSIIVGNTFRTRFKEYYTERVKLQKLITDGSKGYTDDNKSITIDISRQGSFKTYFKQVENDIVLEQPKKVSEVIGGVTVGGKKYVQCIATIYRGNEDVTDVALLRNANAIWFVNGVNVAQGGKVLNMSAEEFADGKDDDVQFQIDISNAKNWTND